MPHYRKLLACTDKQKQVKIDKNSQTKSNYNWNGYEREARTSNQRLFARRITTYSIIIFSLWILFSSSLITIKYSPFVNELTSIFVVVFLIKVVIISLPK